jgi:hypothetical protein
MEDSDATCAAAGVIVSDTPLAFTKPPVGYMCGICCNEQDEEGGLYHYHVESKPAQARSNS